MVTKTRLINKKMFTSIYSPSFDIINNSPVSKSIDTTIWVFLSNSINESGNIVRSLTFKKSINI